MRPCPIPGLCLPGVGGGDDLCFGENTGPYCLVCPSSHYASVNGVCIEYGSSREVVVLQVVGFILAVWLLLLGTVAFIGACKTNASFLGDGNSKEGPLPLPSATEISTQRSIFTKLRHKLLGLGRSVACLRRGLRSTVSQKAAAQVEDLVVTIEMYVLKLARNFARVANQEQGRSVNEALSNAELLCPIIDQLAAALAGLSGAGPEDVAGVIQYARRVIDFD